MVTNVPVFNVMAFPPRFIVDADMKGFEFIPYTGLFEMSCMSGLPSGRIMEKRTKAWLAYERLAMEVFGR